MIVTSLTEEDYEPAAVFLEKATNNIFKKELWLDRFEYWWRKNPAMRKEITRGWVIRGENGEIGGFLGNIPLKYYIVGEEVLACAVTSWYVDKKYSQKSLDLLIPFLKQQTPSLLLNTTPIEKVEKILLKIGFNNLENEWLKKDAFYPLCLFEFWNFIIQKFVTNKGVLLFILRLAGLIAVPTIKIFQIICKLRLPPIDDKYTFSEIRRFDRSYRLLWHKFKKRFKILALRDDRTLNWFFFGSKGLSATRKVIELKYVDEIMGYAAIKEVEYVMHNKPYYYLEVIDMVILSDDDNAYYTLLKGLILLTQNSKKKFAFIMINPLNKKIENYLIRFGFTMKKGKSKILYKYTGDHELATSDYNSFFATPLDGDRCFFP